MIHLTHHLDHMTPPVDPETLVALQETTLVDEPVGVGAEVSIVAEMVGVDVVELVGVVGLGLVAKIIFIIYKL